MPCIFFFLFLFLLSPIGPFNLMIFVGYLFKVRNNVFLLVLLDEKSEKCINNLYYYHRRNFEMMVYENVSECYLIFTK